MLLVLDIFKKLHTGLVLVLDVFGTFIPAWSRYLGSKADFWLVWGMCIYLVLRPVEPCYEAGITSSPYQAGTGMSWYYCLWSYWSGCFFDTRSSISLYTQCSLPTQLWTSWAMQSFVWRKCVGCCWECPALSTQAAGYCNLNFQTSHTSSSLWSLGKDSACICQR
jgi:hypothetical protein